MSPTPKREPASRSRHVIARRHQEPRQSPKKYSGPPNRSAYFLWRHGGRSHADRLLTRAGATGPLGRRITQAALAEGHHVTAFVRTGGRLDPHPGLREVTGDVLDPGSVAAAMPGHDAVISALGHSSPSSAGRDLYPGASHIISAMQTAGAGRLIWISSHGVGDARGQSGFVFERIFVPLRLRAEFADKERQEAVVAASDLDWTIVRPARLTNGPATGRLRAQARLQVSIRDSISRADVAQFVIHELEYGEHLLTAPTVAAT